jgi:HAD superfamily hydrolase (TIGR01490 family)
VAFFDVDETIVRGNSARLYAMEAWRRGDLTLWTSARLIWWALLYRVGLLPMRGWMHRASRVLAGVDEARFAESARDLFRESMGRRLDPAVLERIVHHQDEGHHLVLLTATLRQVVIPLLERLGFHDILSNELIYEDGKILGGFVEPLCYGVGKVVRARDYLEKVGASFEESYFYSDSIADLPMLEAVGHPVVVNPEKALIEIARNRGWPDLRHGPTTGDETEGSQGDAPAA